MIIQGAPRMHSAYRLNSLLNIGMSMFYLMKIRILMRII